MKVTPLLALPLLLAACGGTSTPQAQGPPSTTGTTQPCSKVGSGGSSAQSSSKPSETMLLTDVKVAASGCEDRVIFDFRTSAGAEPGFTVRYRPADEAQTEDASGRHIPIAGKAFLVVRFEPAATADVTKPELEITYKGPRSIKPAGLRWVRQVTKTGDFEAVLTWSIGLSQERPFHVITSGSPARLTIVFG